MARVALDQVTKHFDKVVAVDGMTLEAADQEFLVLVGPSGCGKTTTLRLVAGLDDVTSGTISIGNRVVNRVSPRDRDIAMVFQSYALYPHMNVFNNMAFGLKLRHTKRAVIQRRVREAATLLDIEPLLKRKPRELSGGQRQRVALGRAIVREPAVFLMDEPLSNLDALLRVQTRRMLIDLHRRLQTTVIYVTHDQTEAMTMGTQIAVMNAGVLQQVDKPQTLYNYPRNTFVAAFIGTPQMNLVEGVLASSNGTARFVAGDVSLDVSQGAARAAADAKAERVVLGMRPEQVRIVPAGVAGAQTLPAAVDLVEHMGAEVFVYLKVGASTTLAVRLPASQEPTVGSNLSVSIDPAQLHLFDAGTGSALAHGATPARAPAETSTGEQIPVPKP